MLAFFLALQLCIACAQENPAPRILIVGDSWAHSIATEGRDGIPGFGTFDAILHESGFDDTFTRGNRTAWGGRRADQWARPEMLETIGEELRAFPAITIVALIIGGNDLLRELRKPGFADLGGPERRELFDKIGRDIAAIVEFCLNAREDIRVAILGYDYIDAETAQRVLPDFDFHGLTVKQVNRAFRELGAQQAAVAAKYDRCEYVDNFGALNGYYGHGKSSDDDVPMPAEAHVGDGIHPTAAAHAILLRRAFQEVLGPWLRGVAGSAEK